MGVKERERRDTKGGEEADEDVDGAATDKIVFFSLFVFCLCFG